MTVVADQRKLDIELSHNQVGYLSDHRARFYEEFNSMIVPLNSCRITHAQKANPVICSDTIRDFRLSTKVNRNGVEGVGSIEAKIQGKDIIVTEAVIREVLKFGDQTQHPTSFGKDKVRFLVHVFLLCISVNKNGLDQLNQIQTSAMVALVNDRDYNFTTFIFDNMRRMLENPKKKIFMLYPIFVQMILDEKYPELVKSANLLNLKPMGPSCFDMVKRSRESAKKHQFLGKYPLDKFRKCWNLKVYA
ncbi:hypothetical protein Hanom_Chr06g00532781 [Helianthus anomalus]